MRKKLGELIMTEQLISQEELVEFLVLQKKKRESGESAETTRLGQILVEHGIIIEENLKRILEDQNSSAK